MAEIILKDGSTAQDPRLGRVQEFDEASRGFQVRTLLDARQSLVKIRRRVKPGVTLDQGHEGACTGFSASHAAESRPFGIKGIDNAWARAVYFENQQNDDWDGGEYPGATPVYSGSSVLASMKTLKNRGLISSYRWVGAGSQTPVDDVIDTLKYVGPVCFGINWYPSMFDVQPSGLLEVDATVDPAGGHAICGHDAVYKKLPETTKRALYVVLQNSWGTGWGVKYKGQGGFAYVKVEDIETLLTKGGEGAVPLKTQ